MQTIPRFFWGVDLSFRYRHTDCRPLSLRLSLFFVYCCFFSFVTPRASCQYLLTIGPCCHIFIKAFFLLLVFASPFVYFITFGNFITNGKIGFPSCNVTPPVARGRGAIGAILTSSSAAAVLTESMLWDSALLFSMVTLVIVLCVVLRCGARCVVQGGGEDEKKK